MDSSRQILLMLIGVLIIPTGIGTNQTGNDTIQTLQFINISDNAVPPDTETITRCMTESLILRKECSNYYHGTVIDLQNNWWVLTGSFFASFVMVGFMGWYNDMERSLIIESIAYSVITTGIVLLLIAAGLNMFVLNYLTHTPKYMWVFASFGFWGAIIAYIAGWKTHGNAKKYKLRELDLLTRLRSQ